MTAPSLPKFETIAEDFQFIDDWDEKYRYLIDLGRHLPPFAPDQKTEATRIKGCASQVWLMTEWDDDGALQLSGESEAAIVNGLVALTIALFNGQSAAGALALDAHAALRDLGLDDHITPQRANGVASMITRIKSVAAQHADGT